MDSNRDISEISTNKGSAGFPGSGGGSSGAGSGSGSGGQFDSATLEERQLLGRYGVWLLVGLCTPNQDTSIEILGRLLSMLFHWFHVTAYSFDGTKKSLMHLIFSVGNLTLRIFIHLMNVERRWTVDGRRRDLWTKSRCRFEILEVEKLRVTLSLKFFEMYICIYIYFFKFFNNLFDLSCGYGGCAFSDKYSLAQKSYDECYNVEIERTLRIDRVISEILILPKIINSVYFSIFVRRLKIYHIVSCSYKILSTIVNTNYWK